MFGIIALKYMTCADTKAASPVSYKKLPEKASAFERKLSDREETMLKIGQMLEHVNKIDWANFDPKSRK